MNLKKLSVWACSGLLVSLFSGLTPLNNNLCNLKTSTMVYAEGRVFNDECIDSTTYNKETKTLTIPDGFTEIGTRDLARLCPNLETVNIPASVEEIGPWAFFDCKNLTKVNIASGSKLKKIRDGAFLSCTALEVITLPEGLRKISNMAFAECSSLEEINIPNNVSKIGRLAFAECTSLGSISLPQEIKKIEDNTFTGCSSLENINIPNNVHTIGSKAFSDCTSLREISLPSDLQLIGRGAFNSCTSFTEIRIPDKVEMVADDAFKNCSCLETLSMANNVEIFDSFLYSLISEKRTVNVLDVPSNTAVKIRTTIK